MPGSADPATPDAEALRRRKAAGPERPAYFGSQDVDRVMAIVLALTAEVASLRERLDTHERLAADGMAPAPDTVEAYSPDAAAIAQRQAWHDTYIRRLFRVITEDTEALAAPADP
jgi:hypothetical protein